MKRIPRRIFVAGLKPQEVFKREAIKLVSCDDVVGLRLLDAY